MSNTLSSRAGQLLRYVGSESYPCPIGAQMARAGELPLVELLPSDQPLERDAKIRQGVDHLIRRRVSIVLYPEDPTSVEDLAALHAHVYPPTVTEICLRDLERLQNAGTLTLPQTNVRRLNQEQLGVVIDAAYNRHMPPISPAVDMVQQLGVSLAADLRASQEAIAAAVHELLVVDPNIYPVYADEPVQSIVIGPAFPGARGESTAVRPRHEQGDHGRRCSVTALVMNFLPDVQAALQTQPGRQASEWLDRMPREFSYSAAHVLAGVQRRRSVIVQLLPDILAHLTPPPARQPVVPPRQTDVVPPVFLAGRNQPCPCGSGKKFKHCHGRR